MQLVRAVLVLAVALATPHMAALAHHSFAAEYDSEKPVTVSGTVTKVEWMNPHIYVTLDVKGADGQVAQWRLEGYPPNMLVRQGWKKDVTLKPGTEVTVTGWRSRLEIRRTAPAVRSRSPTAASCGWVRRQGRAACSIEHANVALARRIAA